MVNRKMSDASFLELDNFSKEYSFQNEIEFDIKEIKNIHTFDGYSFD
ncbi:2615_t:CDS:2 [Cetraspora pellucida]|uniref:2615_t:CDS:1 n=1 Tax=Cetraspora pellucida TaxID=1433469 RepID=A0A9N9BX50_9GLOM|nr:2615_t:CDS:2 [Cetraspora pellucida]